MSRLKTIYDKEFVVKLMSKLSLKNKHEVPKIKKVILNMGLGEDALDGKKLKASADDLALIAGQKPVITKFKKSISKPESSAKHISPDFLEKYLDLIKEFFSNVSPFSVGLLRLNSDVE